MAAIVKTNPILYSFRRCPYAMRARMALIAGGVTWDHREISLRHKPDSMLAASPKATVPVLILQDGKVIDESLDIMRWALGQNDPEKWMASADPALVASYDDGFKHHLDRYKYASHFGENPQAHRAAGVAILSRLASRLDGSDYIGGSARGFSDVAIFPFVRQFAGVDYPWFEANSPREVQRWLARLTGSNLFDRAMIRQALWSEKDV